MTPPLITKTICMHLLYICETIDFGVGQNVMDLVELALSHGHSVTLIWSPKRTGVEYASRIRGIRSNDFTQVVVPMSRAPGPQDAIVIIRTLIHILGKRPRPTVIHGFSSKGGAIARIIGLIISTPRFYSPHAYILSNPELGKVSRFFYAQIERILNAGAFIVCTSSEEEEITKALGTGTYRFIPNGITLPSASHRDPNPKSIQVSFVGRLCHQKNPLAFLELAKLLKHLPIHFNVFGDGELMNSVKCYINDHHLETVKVHGRTDLNSIWSQTDILICTSLYEGFPYSFVQAIAHGVPVLSTSVGGTESIIASEEIGCIYNLSDPTPAIRFVDRYVSDPTFQAAVRAATIQHSKRFSRDTMFESMFAFYQEALN